MSTSGGPSGQAVVAQTPAGGVALINGTQNFLQITAPNDGKQHAVTLCASKDITSAETGGLVGLAYTIGGVPFTATVFAGGGGAGIQQPGSVLTVMVDPNTTVTFDQTSALTVGASKVYGSILLV